MPKGITLSDTEAWRRLGQRSQVLPDIFDQYMPTLSFGDVGDLVPAPGPPRGIAGDRRGGVAFRFPTYHIAANLSAGLVVYFLRFQAALAGSWRIGRFAGSSGLTVRPHLSQSTAPDAEPLATFHSDLLIPAPTGPLIIENDLNFTMPLRIFVPRNNFLEIAFANSNLSGTDCIVQWFEYGIGGTSVRS